ncbi:MAG: hypothetical protein L0Z62_08485 [Gemmataceae bacterium]|nr:hypothetical protein [Gemmataceae bacterium]
MNTFRWVPFLALPLGGLLALGGIASEPGAPAPAKVAATRELAPEDSAAQPPQAPGAVAAEQAGAQPKLDFVRPRLPRVGLEILVGGRTLPTVRHLGKIYLPVPRLDLEYEIRVSNHGPGRVAALVAVDGLSVITGQPHSEDQPGYIVAPSGQIRIKGWRRSLEAVAAFRFVEREKSYAALMGHPEKVGAITLLAIEEQVRWPRPGVERDASSSAKLAQGKAGSVGTEYGREIDDRVYYVPFVRSSVQWSVTISYDSPEALRRAGVPIDLLPPSPWDGGFVPPPPGYKASR